MSTPRLMSTTEILTLLANQPEQIGALSADVAQGVLATRPQPDEWSALENLRHLYACEVVWGKRITDMLDQDHPSLRALNPMTWLARTDLSGHTFGSLLEVYCTHRTGLLERLRELPGEDWGRSATFTGGGRPRMLSVHTEADAIARHERTHIRTVRRTLAATVQH